MGRTQHAKGCCTGQILSLARGHRIFIGPVGRWILSRLGSNSWALKLRSMISGAVIPAESADQTSFSVIRCLQQWWGRSQSRIHASQQSLKPCCAAATTIWVGLAGFCLVFHSCAAFSMTSLRGRGTNSLTVRPAMSEGIVMSRQEAGRSCFS